MWQRAITVGVVATLVVGRTAQAQLTVGTVARDLRNGAADILHVWSAPARADARDWAAFGLVVAAVAATSALDDQIDAFLVGHPKSVLVASIHHVREGGDLPLVDLGSGKRLQPLSGVLYLAGFVADSRALRDAGLGCAASNQAQSIVHELVKELVVRRRPRLAAGDQYDIRFELGGSSEWELHSFYGGHAANIMACVTFWNTRFDLGWAEPALYALALGLGAGRVADQRHWASDTMLGMAFGHAIGRSVARRSLARAARSGGRDAGRSPLAGVYLAGTPGGAVIGWTGEF